MARILTRDDVARLLTMADCIEAIDAAQRWFSAGDAVMPVRLTMAIPERGNHLSMPAALPKAPALGMKSITYFPENPERGLPAILGVVLLLDFETGRSLAVMDAAHLTGVRTAAASAVATRALALPEVSTLALIGAGVQAVTHLWAMSEVRRLKRVRVASRTRASAERFAAEQSPRYPGIEIVAVDTPEEAIRGAGIVCAVSASTQPVTDADWIVPGCHINGVGSHSPGAREIDGETMRRGRVVCDSRDANLTECGDCLLPISEGLFGPEHVSDEIGEVLLGTKPGRTSDDQITIYQSCGIAIQDVAAGKLVYERAVAEGVGVEVDL